MVGAYGALGCRCTSRLLIHPTTGFPGQRTGTRRNPHLQRQRWPPKNEPVDNPVALEPIEITAGALHLRPPELADVDAITRACQDQEIQQFTRVPAPYRREDARHFVTELSPQGWATGTAATFVVLAATSGEVLGSVGLHGIADGGAEVGYWVAAPARRRGVGRTAVGAVCRWGFAALELERITWLALVGNTGSRRLVERLGFRYEGLLRRGMVHRGERVDCWIGSLLPEDPLCP
jgi:RimJ/RimL family protein N-acetyltransferase